MKKEKNKEIKLKSWWNKTSRKKIKACRWMISTKSNHKFHNLLLVPKLVNQKTFSSTTVASETLNKVPSSKLNAIPLILRIYIHAVNILISIISPLNIQNFSHCFCKPNQYFTEQINHYRFTRNLTR